jgi:methylenetetrahydrofolate dehydrogenase (NADP+) / methenyltetrahydrofolate cyclohydrolase
MNNHLVIDGKKLAHEIRLELKKEIIKLKQDFEITPTLAIILVGNNPASELYVKIKTQRAQEIGIKTCTHKFSEHITIEFLINKIQELNTDNNINGIIVQMPLPNHIQSNLIINHINPLKDVDGFHPENIGKLWSNQDCLVPCTPQGCIDLLKSQQSNLSGLNALVIGRSLIVGKPMACLLMKEDCTVTIAHSKTHNLPTLCQQADIIIAAIGKPRFIKKEWVKKNSLIIDVGINKITNNNNEDRIVGDVDFDNVKDKIKAITPVPGGVGPMTVAHLLKNTVKATMMQNKM